MASRSSPSQPMAVRDLVGVMSCPRFGGRENVGVSGGIGRERLWGIVDARYYIFQKNRH